MKLLIVFIMALACVSPPSDKRICLDLFFILFFAFAAHAFIPKLILKFSEEDDEEENFFKIPKINIFSKLLFEKKEKDKDKEKESEKIFLNPEKIIDMFDIKVDKLLDKKEDKFKARLLSVLDDKENAKTVYDKLTQYRSNAPSPSSSSCRYSPPDDCEYSYFS